MKHSDTTCTYAEKSLLCAQTIVYLNNFSSSKRVRDSLPAGLKILSAYKFQIQYRLEAQHKNVDAFCRIPCCQLGFQSDLEKYEIIPPSEIRTISAKKMKATEDRDDQSSSHREKKTDCF